MSKTVLPKRRILTWWEMVVPKNEQEMREFLQVYIGTDSWRTPRRLWEDLWRLKRGNVPDKLGPKRFSNWAGNPKRQKGIIGAVAAFGQGPTTNVNLSAISDTDSQVSPTQSREHLGYDSDGRIVIYSGTGPLSGVTFTNVTTQTDDTNDHTNEWWTQAPSTNEGLNWDIRFTNDTSSGTGELLNFNDSSDVKRTVNTWYLLDTVSNDRVDGTNHGVVGAVRVNGTAKSPSYGTLTFDADVEIRATGTGSAVASHAVFLQVNGTIS